ncbi:MAG: NF038130 family PEP-CTERM protein [Spirulinaceae cyanobacterium]
MKGTIKKFLLGASVVVGASAMSMTDFVYAVNPAFAGSFSSSGPTTVYESFVDSDGKTKTRKVTGADLSTILSGDSSAPGGNVELYDQTDGLNLTQFKDIGSATLTADLDGKIVNFSSLTYEDWFGTGSGVSEAYGANNFANQWFGKAMAKYGSGYNGMQKVGLYKQFLGSNGFQRFSDPNVAYVGKDGDTVTFGLAGHSDAGNVHPALQGWYASEVVKVSYKGQTELFYSFDKSTDSGQYEVSDGTSHDGNFEFSFQWGEDDAEKVPEPSAILGLIALSGVVATKRKQNKA